MKTSTPEPETKSERRTRNVIDAELIAVRKVQALLSAEIEKCESRALALRKEWQAARCILRLPRSSIVIEMSPDRSADQSFAAWLALGGLKGSSTPARDHWEAENDYPCRRRP